MADRLSDARPFTVEQVIWALGEAGGIYYAAAAKLGCDRDLIAAYAEEHEDIQAALERIALQNDDVAEVAFLQAVQEKQAWAVQRQLQRADERRRAASSARGADGRFPPGNGSGYAHLIPSITIPPDATPAEEREIRRRRAAVMEQIIRDVALTADRPETRAMAAAKLQEIDHPRVTRNVNLNLTADDVTQLSDDDLDAEFARLEGATGPALAGEVPEGLPAPLPDVRH